MFFPILVDVKKVVIIGGGREWRRKVAKWSGIADQVLVATDEPLKAPPNVTVLPRLPQISDLPQLLQNTTLVISEHPDAEFTTALHRACRKHNILLNVVDNRKLSNVFATSYIDKPNLLATISTKGSCAYYSKRIRLELDDEMDHRSHVAGILAEVRRAVEPANRETALETVYTDRQFTEFIGQRRYDDARKCALDIAKPYFASDDSR